MPDISLEKAYFVALWTETLLYGSYTVLFAICVYILRYRSKSDKSKRRHRPLLIAAIAMFVLSTIHMGVDLARGIAAFVDRDTGPGGVEYYDEIWLWINIFKQALYVTNNVIADGLVVYRLYIVWGFSWKITVFPIIMLISTTICGYGAVFSFSLTKPGQNVFKNDIAHWATPLFSLSLATNIIVTGLIAGRIYWISRRTDSVLGKGHAKKYTRAVAIILESGLIYSFSLMTLLILYCLRTKAQFIAFDITSQIMAIVPTLIIVRVGLGVTTQEVNSTQVGTAVRSYQPTAVPMQIRKVVQVDDDTDDGSTDKMGKGSSLWMSDQRSSDQV